MAKIIKQTGGKVLVWGVFTDPLTALPTEPLALQFKVRLPDATVISKFYGIDAEVVRTDVGVYYYRLELTIDGTYNWKWIANATDSAVVIVGSLDSLSNVNY